MEKIQQELKLLNQEKADTTAALEQAKGKVNEQNKKISELDAKIQEAVAENDAMEIKLAQVNDMYSQAQNEVNSLTHSKLQLTNEIDELEKTTEALRNGIINMREGQVYYRAGEVVFAGVMRGGLKHEENMIQMNWLLQNANEAALQRLGVIHDEQKPLQAIWIGKNVAVKAGVLPDPMTGKVGSMDAATMIEAANSMRRTRGSFILRAYAKGDITTAGPVRVRLEVIPVNE